ALFNSRQVISCAGERHQKRTSLITTHLKRHTARLPYKLPLKWPMAPVYDRWQIQKREDCCGIAGTAPISGSVL
ncbi:hypothetical protein Q604_UNBC10494G0001, partial [human gut metagenome]